MCSFLAGRPRLGPGLYFLCDLVPRIVDLTKVRESATLPETFAWELVAAAIDKCLTLSDNGGGKSVVALRDINSSLELHQLFLPVLQDILVEVGQQLRVIDLALQKQEVLTNGHVVLRRWVSQVGRHTSVDGDYDLGPCKHLWGRSVCLHFHKHKNELKLFPHSQELFFMRPFLMARGHRLLHHVFYLRGLEIFRAIVPQVVMEVLLHFVKVSPRYSS